jgi:putative transcriptional regulator
MKIKLDKLTSKVYIIHKNYYSLRRIMKTNLRKFRFLQGELSQQKLAGLVSVSRPTIVSIERGDYAPSVKLALLLAEKLETTVEELFILEEKDHV